MKVMHSFSQHLMISCRKEDSFSWHQMSTLYHRTHFLHLQHLVPQLAVICACARAGKFSLWIMIMARLVPPMRLDGARF